MFWLTLAGWLAFFAGPILGSRFVAEPLYDVMLSWDAHHSPADWLATRARYYRINAIRTTGSLAALVLFVAALAQPTLVRAAPDGSLPADRRARPDRKPTSELSRENVWPWSSGKYPRRWRILSVMGRPRQRTASASGSSTPSTIRMAVVLPAPLGPTKPNICPSATVNDRSSSATRSP
jgi:hypothetical protein